MTARAACYLLVAASLSLHVHALRMRAPCMAANAPAASVTLLGFRPSLPPVDPQQTPALRVQCGAPLAPTWVSDGPDAGSLEGLAWLDSGRHLVWSPEENTVSELPPTAEAQGACGQTVFGSRTLVTCGAAGLGALDVFTGAATSLALKGIEALNQPTAAVPLAEGRLLIACGEAGEVTCLQAEGAAVLLLAPGVGATIGSMCVTDGERRLLLAVGGAVLSVPLDVDLNAAWPPLELAPASTGAAAIAADRQGNVYVCGAGGVTVLDEDGEPMVEIALPAAATGCCFGGPGLSTLFITAGDGVWSVTTNVQGVAPPTDSFRRKMDKYVAAGDFRHAGW